MLDIKEMMMVNSMEIMQIEYTVELFMSSVKAS